MAVRPPVIAPINITLPSTLPNKFVKGPKENLKHWILSVERYCNNNSWQWTTETNKIINPASLCEEKTAACAPRYMNRMEGIRGERIDLEYANRANFVTSMEKTFVTVEEIRESKQLIRELKYKNFAEYVQE